MGALFSVVGAAVVVIATTVALPYTIVDLIEKYREDGKSAENDK